MSQVAPVEVEEEQQAQDPAWDAAGGGSGGSDARGWAARLLPLAPPALVSPSLLVGTALLVIAAVPQTTWQSMGLPADGPIPHALVPAEAGLFYLIPAVVGALCRRWQVALVLATAPAWIDLGVFVVSAAGQLGPFYLTQNHSDGGVGTLELYAALGGFGWLARSAALLEWRERAGSTETRNKQSSGGAR